MPQLEKLSSNRVSTGTLTKYSFPSSSLGGLTTIINVFVPDSKSPVPVIFYLAGLTCTEDTGAQKGGMFNKAGEEGIAVVLPDTSPRGAGIEGEDEDWDFGTGECERASNCIPCASVAMSGISATRSTVPPCLQSIRIPALRYVRLTR